MAPSKSSSPDRGRRDAWLDAAARAGGRPRSLVLIVAGILLWVTVNTVLPRTAAPDPPRFQWLERVSSLVTRAQLVHAPANDASTRANLPAGRGLTPS